MFFALTDCRRYLYQWDTNQKMYVVDDSIDKVQFSNTKGTLSLIENTYREGEHFMVNIPDAALEQENNLIVYGISGGSTLGEQMIEIRKRPNPVQEVI